MNKYQKELMQYALRLSNMLIMDCNLMVNRRNGYYAVDMYDLENGKFVGYLFCGDYKECKSFLRGMLEAYYHERPF